MYVATYIHVHVRRWVYVCLYCICLCIVAMLVCVLCVYACVSVHMCMCACMCTRESWYLLVYWMQWNEFHLIKMHIYVHLIFTPLIKRTHEERIHKLYMSHSWDTTGIHSDVAQKSCAHQTSTTLWSKFKVFGLVLAASWPII